VRTHTHTWAWKMAVQLKSWWLQ